MEEYKNYTKRIIEGQYCIFSDINNDSSPITFIIVPGNPSMPELYIHLGNLLTKKYKYPFIISSLLSNDPKTFSLEKSIELKKHFFEYLFNNNPKGKYIVIGHSIGCYISLNAMKKINDLNQIIGIYCIFPALKNLYNCFPINYKIITFNFLIINILSCLLCLFKIMPFCLINFIFKLFTNIPKDKIEFIIPNLIPSLGKQMMILAKDEGKYIKEYNSDFILFLNKISDKLNLIYGKKDRYANDKIAKEMKGLVPNANIKIVDIQHAFVLKHTQEIFEIISNMIKYDINK